MRRDDSGSADPEDAGLLEAAEARLRAGARDSRSNVVRVSARPSMAVDACSRAIETPDSQPGEPVEVQPFRAHLPLSGFQAAGGLAPEMEPLAEDWVPAREGLRLPPDLSVGRVVAEWLRVLA
jgi:hypothetical protein